MNIRYQFKFFKHMNLTTLSLRQRELTPCISSHTIVPRQSAATATPAMLAPRTTLQAHTQTGKTCECKRCLFQLMKTVIQIQKTLITVFHLGSDERADLHMPLLMLKSISSRPCCFISPPDSHKFRQPVTSLVVGLTMSIRATLAC
jgi:hypothetical protein